MKLDWAVQYVAGVLTGGIGTTLVNHWLSGRRDEKQAERERSAEERAEDRARRADHRSRQLARIETIRAGALELRTLTDEHAAKGVHHDCNDPSKGYWIEFFVGLDVPRDGEVERAVTELCDDTITALYSRFDRASFEHGSKLASTDGADQHAQYWTEYGRSYEDLVTALNDLERAI